MDKFEYSYNKNTSMTSRMIVITYPEYPGLVDRLCYKKISVGKIVVALKLALNGINEKPYLDVEDAWWELQSRIQYNVEAVNTLKKMPGDKLPLINELNVIDQQSVIIINEHPNAISSDIITKLTAINTGLIFDRNNIEDTNGWLKSYRGETTSVKRPVVAKVIVPKEDIKILIAYERNNNIRNVEDTIADLAKMNSLLFSMVSTMYASLSSTTKANMPVAEKNLIDYATTKFKNITTRADKQLSVEGTGLVDKLFVRESDISDIIDALTSINN